MKTILHIIDTTGPGGAETVFVELADRMRQRGYRSLVLIKGPGWVQEELTRRGLPPLIYNAKGAFLLDYVQYLFQLIRKENVDLIQSHLLGSNLYAAIAGMITATPVVASYHGMVDISPDERFRRLKYKIMKAGISRFVVVSNNLRQQVKQQGMLNDRKTEVIYNGIATQDYNLPKAHRLRTELGLQNAAVLVGCLGNIRAAKGYDVLLNAAGQLKAVNPNIHFVIAGQQKGDLMQRLLEQQRSLRVEDSVHFLGFQADSAEFLSNLDIFLLPSTSEGFSISTIEAMAAGLPVIATRCGGPEEIIETERTGLLVDVNSPEAIAQGLQRVVTTPAFAASIGAQGRAAAIATYDVNAMLDRYQQIYDSIIIND